MINTDVFRTPQPQFLTQTFWKNGGFQTQANKILIMIVPPIMRKPILMCKIDRMLLY